MRSLFMKTLGGLDATYYLSQFIVALVAASVMFVLGEQARIQYPLSRDLWILLLMVNVLLFPYSQFACDSAMERGMGRAFLRMSAPLRLFYRLLSAVVAWVLALVLGPLGLIWLFMLHSRGERQARHPF